MKLDSWGEGDRRHESRTVSTAILEASLVTGEKLVPPSGFNSNTPV
jgi:hypothetical protein